MPTLTLGIDPSLNRTGYAVVECGSRRVVEAGIITTSMKRPLDLRLVELATELDKLLADHDVRCMAVEDLYAHYSHPRTAILMGHARGVILLAAGQRGIAIESYSATHVKKCLTGNGHASKLQMQRAIMATLGLRKMPEPSDVADALAVALCAIVSAKRAG